MRNLTEGNIHKSFWLFSIPIILQVLFSDSFSIINTSIASLYLGTEGLAATSATSAYIGAIKSPFVGFAAGISVAVANYFGAGKLNHIKSVFWNNVLLQTLIVSAISLISIIFYRPIFSFLKVEEIYYEDAKLYYIYSCISIVIQLASQYCAVCCHALGSTVFPFAVGIVDTVVPTALKVLFVAFFKMGVMGIVIVSAISTTFNIASYIVYYIISFKKLGGGKFKLRFSKEYISGPMSYGAPNALQQVSMYLAGFLLAPVRNGLGYVAVASFALANDGVRGVSESLFYASARTSGNYIAQCVGAKRYDKIKSAISVAFIQGSLIVLPFVVFILACPEIVAQMFVDPNKDADSMMLYDNLIYYITHFYIFTLLNMVAAVFHSVFRGIKSSKHLIISSSIKTFSELLASYILCYGFGMGISGLYLGTIIAFALEATYCIVLYISGLWVPKDIRQKVILGVNESESNS